MTTQTVPTTGNLAGEVVQIMNGMLRWQEHIEKAMHHVNMQHSFNDIVGAVLRQEKHFYEFDKCCVIMQFEMYPQYSIYHCFIAAGDMQAIKDTEPQMKEIAKALGADYLAISGRPGWVRELKKDGWKHTLSILYKEVN